MKNLVSSFTFGKIFTKFFKSLGLRLNKINYLVFTLVFIFCFSCKKDKTNVEPIVSNQLSNGILILNEGLFQLNNSSLSWINLSDLTVNNTFFEQKAGRKLGDTGNDLKRYGGKIYIVVDVSSTVEVLDASTGASLKQISFVNGNQSKEPRSITFFGSKAFVSCFDGFVDVLDTTNLTIEKRIPVGLNPDEIITSSSKIFVSNSGGLNSPTMDSTISIINPTTLMEESKLIVGKNPGSMEIVGNNLFVNVRGNYGSIPASLKRINLTTLQIEETYSFKPLILEQMFSNLLIAYEENQVTKLGIFDVSTNTWLNPNLMDISSIETLFNVQYEGKNNHIYLFDAHGYTVSGEILEYDSLGNKIRSFKVGLNPNSLLLF